MSERLASFHQGQDGSYFHYDFSRYFTKGKPIPPDCLSDDRTQNERIPVVRLKEITFFGARGDALSDFGQQ